MNVRSPSVAGTFYPAEPSELRTFCSSRLKTFLPPIQAKAIILPHAGYLYSGDTACSVLSKVCIPSQTLIIGPNHRGIGYPFALSEDDVWETPLGRVQVNSKIQKELMEVSSEILTDRLAHFHEHSLEVEVPLLQLLNPDLKITPLAIGSLDFPKIKRIAQQIGKFLKSQKDLLIVVSTDMNHYENERITQKKDRYAIQAIENLDAEALVRAVKKHRISMCGLGPVYLLLMMRESLGFKKVTLVDYRTSAAVSQDFDKVVGYAGFIIE